MSDADERLTEVDRRIADAKRRARRPEPLFAPYPPPTAAALRGVAGFVDAMLFGSVSMALGQFAQTLLAKAAPPPPVRMIGRFARVRLNFPPMVGPAVGAVVAVAVLVMIAAVLCNSLGKRLVGLRVAFVVDNAPSRAKLALRELLRFGPLTLLTLVRGAAAIFDYYGVSFTPPESAEFFCGVGGFLHAVLIVLAIQSGGRAWYDHVCGTVVAGGPHDVNGPRGFAVDAPDAEEADQN